MNPSSWEDWAVETLRRGNLSEPPEHVLNRAYAIGASRRTLPRWLAAAAMLTVVVTGGVLLVQRRPPSLPSAPVDSTLRSSEVDLIGPSGTLERAPETFSWGSVDGAASYRLRLLAVDGAILLERTTEDASWTLTEERLTMFHPAVTYTWEVEAFDSDGALVARSQPARFEIRP